MTDCLEKIDVHITDHCNLNCRGCTHFSPLAEPFYLNLDNFKADIMRVSALTQAKLGFLFLLGGEPLLHPDLDKFFPIARKAFPNDTRIVIITNAILLPQAPDSFWEACRDNRVEIWISDYKLKIDYKSINEKAKSYGVFCGYTSTATDEEGKKTWGFWKLDLEGKQYWVDSFSHCAVKNCVTLKKGKLYTCPTLAHIEHFNKFFKVNLEVTPYDYVDIYKIDSHEAILKSMVKPVPFCRHCKTREYTSCYWEPTKKDINEWI